MGFIKDVSDMLKQLEKAFEISSESKRLPNCITGEETQAQADWLSFSCTFGTPETYCHPEEPPPKDSDTRN